MNTVHFDRHLLLTGGHGRLARRLSEILTASGARVTALSRDDLDVTNFHAVVDGLRRHNPTTVIHAAAWTDVDGCARDPERAMRVNGLSAGHVAAASFLVGAQTVYVSTNEVFASDDPAHAPFGEYHAPAPVNAYGSSKLVGEQATRHHNPNHMLVRTSWVFAHNGRNFIHSILNAARDGKPLRVVTDEIASPTYNDDLADGIAALLMGDAPGIYHLTNGGWCSRYDFARYILDRAGYAATPIEPITRADWPRPSSPPAFSALANVAAAAQGVTLRPWQAAVDAFLTREGLLADA